MLRRRVAAVTSLLAASLLLAAGTTSASAAPLPAAAAAPTGRTAPPPGSLLSVAIEQGALEKAANGRYVLTVTPENGRVTWFSDRPQRLAGHLPASDLVRLWSRLGFAADPPESALVTNSGRGEQSRVVELSRPRWKDGQLVFDARLRSGARATGPFTNASLFIDGTSMCPTLASAQQQATALLTSFGQIQGPLLTLAQSVNDYLTAQFIQQTASGIPQLVASVNQATTVTQIASQFAIPNDIAWESMQTPLLMEIKGNPTAAETAAVATLQQLASTASTYSSEWNGC